MVVRIVTNLTTVESTSLTLSTIARSLNFGHPCGFLGISLGQVFSLQFKKMDYLFLPLRRNFILGREEKDKSLLGDQVQLENCQF